MQCGSVEVKSTLIGNVEWMDVVGLKGVSHLHQEMGAAREVRARWTRITSQDACYDMALLGRWTHDGYHGGRCRARDAHANMLRPTLRTNNGEISSVSYTRLGQKTFHTLQYVSVNT